jgi:hypothetical protein
VIGRANFAADLLGGENLGLPGPVDALGLARRHTVAPDLDAILNYYHELLLGSRPSPALREKILAAVGPRRVADAESARRIVVLVLASPDAQLA